MTPTSHNWLGSHSDIWPVKSRQRATKIRANLTKGFHKRLHEEDKRKWIVAENGWGPLTGVEIWESGNTEIWQSENWESENPEIWEPGNQEIRHPGNYPSATPTSFEIWGYLLCLCAILWSGDRAPSSFNMSSYRAIWTHARSNSMIFINLTFKKLYYIWTSNFQANGFSTLRKAEDLMPRDIMSS